MAEKENKKRRRNSQKGWNDANPFQGNDTQVMDMDKVMGNLQNHQKDMFELQRQQGTFGGIRDNRPKGWALDRQGLRTPEEVQARINSSPVTQKPNQHQVASQAVAARKGPAWQPAKDNHVGNRGIGGVYQPSTQPAGTYKGYDDRGVFGDQTESRRGVNSVAFDKRNAPAPVGSQQNFFNDGKDLPFGNSSGMAQADQQIANPMNGDLYDQNSQNMSGARNALRNRGGVMVGGKPIQSFQDLDRLVSQQGGQMGGFEAFPESPAQRAARNSPGPVDPGYNQQMPPEVLQEIAKMVGQQQPTQAIVPPVQGRNSRPMVDLPGPAPEPMFNSNPRAPMSMAENALFDQPQQSTVAPIPSVPAGNNQVADAVSSLRGNPQALMALIQSLFPTLGGISPVTKF